MAMSLCENCLENKWNFEIIEDWVKAVCLICDSEVMFPKKKRKRTIEPKTFPKKTTYYSDGWLKGSNPSSIGGGYTVTNGYGKVVAEEEFKKEGFTSNEAELLGACKAIEIAEEGDMVIIDSQVVRCWIGKDVKSKARPDLYEIAKIARKQMLEKNINLIWRPREENLAGHYNEEVHGG